MGVIRWHQDGTADPLREVLPSLPSSVADVLARGLSKDRADRPALWEVLDPISAALMKSARLTVGAAQCTDDQVQAIADLTDFDQQELRSPEGAWADFPNPLEAAQEGLGAALLGARVIIVTK